MHAGIDSGSTLLKATCQFRTYSTNWQYLFMDSGMVSIDTIKTGLLDVGVTDLVVSGINDVPEELAKGFRIIRKDGDPIQNEIEMQAEGVKKFLSWENISLDDFLLVSIGTGTSYTSVKQDKSVRFPLGSTMGGGFMMGLGRLLGAKDYWHLTKTAETGTPPDLLVKDVCKSIKGSTGELIVAHFGKTNGSMADNFAGIMSVIAVAIVKDIYLMMQGKMCDNKDIVFIGSTLRGNMMLQNFLTKYCKAFLGKDPHFIMMGDYSLALGAYLYGKTLTGEGGQP